MTKPFFDTDQHAKRKKRIGTDWIEEIITRNPARATETRQAKGSAPPFSHLANRPLSDQAKALLYARHHVRQGRLDEYEWLVKKVAEAIDSFLETESCYGIVDREYDIDYKITGKDYAQERRKINVQILAQLALRPWVDVGDTLTQTEAAKLLKMPRQTYQYSVAPRMSALDRLIRGWSEELI